MKDSKPRHTDWMTDSESYRDFDFFNVLGSCYKTVQDIRWDNRSDIRDITWLEDMASDKRRNFQKI
jgi:hypothetical protein